MSRSSNASMHSLNSGRQELRLGTFLEVRKGQTYEAKLAGDEGPFLLGMGVFSPDGGFRPHKLRRYSGSVRHEAQAEPGDVVVATTDMGAKIKILGRAARVPDWVGEFAVAAADLGLVVWRTSDPDARSYAYWAMRTEEFRQFCLRFARGTAVRRVSPADIESFPIADPQDKRIRILVAGLEAIDEAAEIRRQLNETLDAIVRARFKSWFLDFEPVHAKAAGRASGLPTPLSDLFPSSFETSKVGPIPTGWRVGTIGEIAEHQRRGIRHSDIDLSTAYIALEHMPRRCIALSDWDAADSVESNKFVFKKGDILFGKLRPYFHKVGVAPLDGVCSTDIVVVTPRNKAWFGLLLGHLSSDIFVAYTSAGSTGTKMPRTNWDQMSRYLIAIPPEPVALALSQVILPEVERIVEGIHEARTLAELRDALLPKLMPDELGVGQREQLGEEPVA